MLKRSMNSDELLEGFFTVNNQRFNTDVELYSTDSLQNSKVN